VSIAIAAAIRLALVLLFLPFSALDKILDFDCAVAQAREVVRSPLLAKACIAAGLAVEIFMSLGVVSGVHDRLCAFALAGYCAATALLWDFLKNFALAGGFLLITFGSTAQSVHRFLEDPLSSTNPYLSDARNAP
jgi:putative oxidoreductase